MWQDFNMNARSGYANGKDKVKMRMGGGESACHLVSACNVPWLWCLKHESSKEDEQRNESEEERCENGF